MLLVCAEILYLGIRDMPYLCGISDRRFHDSEAIVFESYIMKR
jgi:hypothetical protein